MAQASVTIKTTQMTQANLIAMLAEDGSLSDFLNAQIIKRNMTDVVPAFDEMPDVILDEQSNYFPDHTKIPANQLRGVIASLIKKDMMITGEYPNGLEAYYLYNRSAE